MLVHPSALGDVVVQRRSDAERAARAHRLARSASVPVVDPPPRQAPATVGDTLQVLARPIEERVDPVVLARVVKVLVTATRRHLPGALVAAPGPGDAAIVHQRALARLASATAGVVVPLDHGERQRVARLLRWLAGDRATGARVIDIRDSAAGTTGREVVTSRAAR